MEGPPRREGALEASVGSQVGYKLEGLTHTSTTRGTITGSKGNQYYEGGLMRCARTVTIGDL